VDESNQIATLALSRTKAFIRRLRLEYVILLERLENQSAGDKGTAVNISSSPPSPTLLTESLNYNNAKSYETQTARTSLTNKSTNTLPDAPSSGALRLRDPELPKRPSNAYLIYCEIEKERVRQELEEDPTSAPNDLSKTLTEEWKNLDDESRKPYYKLYEDDRERYHREMSIYNQRRLVAEDEVNHIAEQGNVKRIKINMDNEIKKESQNKE